MRRGGRRGGRRREGVCVWWRWRWWRGRWWCWVRGGGVRGRNLRLGMFLSPKKPKKRTASTSQVLVQVSLHSEPLLVCSLGQVMQGRDLAQLSICDPQISKNSSDAQLCPSDSESQVMPRRISCQESDAECPCTFGRAGIDWCWSFFAPLLSFECIRSSSLEHMQLVCSWSSFHVSTLPPPRALPSRPKHLSVSIQNISHRLFLSASTSLK